MTKPQFAERRGANVVQQPHGRTQPLAERGCRRDIAPLRRQIRQELCRPGPHIDETRYAHPHPEQVRRCRLVGDVRELTLDQVRNAHEDCVWSLMRLRGNHFAREDST